MKLMRVDAKDWLSGRDSDIDLIVTDPPYGIDYRSGRQGISRVASYSGDERRVRRDYFDKIQGDTRLPLSWITPAFNALKDGGAIYICCNWRKYPELLRRVLRAGFTIKSLIVLVKSNHGMGDLKGSYSPKHELILFAVKGIHRLRFPDGRIPDIWPVKVAFSGSRRPHPNYKPGHWIALAILNSSDAGDLVVDPFCGSGSFVKEAHSMGRRAIGLDIEKWW